MVYADIVHPSSKRLCFLYDATLIGGGSLIVALSAQIAVPLPFSPVPITAQTLAVLMLGALLGSRRGPLCLLAYLTGGSIGLPLFAAGGTGLAGLAGPTGGYLLGMVVAAFVTGLLAERGWDRHAGRTLLAMLMGNLTVYAFGLPWLARFVGVDSAAALGLVPFIPGDLLKLAVATLLLPSAWRLGLKRVTRMR